MSKEKSKRANLGNNLVQKTISNKDMRNLMTRALNNNKILEGISGNLIARFYIEAHFNLNFILIIINRFSWFSFAAFILIPQSLLAKK